jgi:hypothetical protein
VKKRGKSLQIVKTESIPLNLVIVECKFDFDYQEKTAQTEKIFFNHSIHHNIPQRKKINNSVQEQQLQRSKIQKCLFSLYI